MYVLVVQQWLDLNEGSHSVLVLSGLQDQSGLLSIQAIRTEVQKVQQGLCLRAPHVVPRGNQQGSNFVQFFILF